MNGATNIIVLIGVFSLLAFLIFIVLLFTRLWYYRSDRRGAEMKSKIHQILDQYLNEEVSLEDTLSAMSGFSKRNAHHDLWIDAFIVITDQFSGVYMDKVFQLYQDSGLYKRSLRKLKSSGKDTRVRAMHELSMLEYKPAYDLIIVYMNSRSSEIRRNARVALVKLKKKQGLLELRNVRGNISDWTAINIMSTLKRHPMKLNEEELNLLKNAENQYVRRLTYELENTVYVS